MLILHFDSSFIFWLFHALGELGPWLFGTNNLDTFPLSHIFNCFQIHFHITFIWEYFLKRRTCILDEQYHHKPSWSYFICISDNNTILPTINFTVFFCVKCQGFVQYFTEHYKYHFVDSILAIQGLSYFMCKIKAKNI